MINILLTGCTGQVGSKILNLLKENNNYKIFLPIRREIKKYKSNDKLIFFYYDLKNPIDNNIFREIDIFIHAATAWGNDSIKVNVNR